MLTTSQPERTWLLRCMERWLQVGRLATGLKGNSYLCTALTFGDPAGPSASSGLALQHPYLPALSAHRHRKGLMGFALRVIICCSAPSWHAEPEHCPCSVLSQFLNMTGYPSYRPRAPGDDHAGRVVQRDLRGALREGAQVRRLRRVAPRRHCRHLLAAQPLYVTCTLIQTP